VPLLDADHERLAELDAGNLPADIEDIPTVAEFNARTLVAASYFDPALDVVASVTAVGTTTTNSDMRGTDNAALAATALSTAIWTAARAGYLDELNAPNIPADIDTLLTRITAAVALASVCTEARLAELDVANLPADVAAVPTAAENVNEWETQSQTDPTGFHVNLQEIADTAQTAGDLAALINALQDLSAAQVNAEMVDVLTVDTISEMTQGIPPIAPTFEEAVMYLYMSLTKQITTTSALMAFFNDAGTAIWTKALLDDTTTYTETKGASGP